MHKAFIRLQVVLCAALICAVMPQEGFGQTKSKIELLGAKDLKYDKRMGVDAQRLIGDVKFRHQGALMYCDSAYLYNASNSLDAYGNVKINQGDTLYLYGDKLNYNGDTRLVKVRNNVRLEDKEMTLTTHILDYNRNTEVAVFYDRGTIVSTENDNTLIACEGDYAAKEEFFHFRDSVVLINPKYTVETDTLDYDNVTEIAYFEGPTFIFSEENTIYCENGWYDTKKDISQFNENAYLDNGKQVLRGDSIWYSRNEGLGRAFQNVSIIDTTDQYIINGHKGAYFENEQRTMVTEMAELIQFDQADSLFLHADTLLAIEDPVRGNLVYAYRGVRFFRKDMQGVADSMFFAKADSTIYMYHDPVLWSDHLQITGDTMEIINKATGIDRLLVYQNAMLNDRVDSTQYNQIKGRHLTGYFEKNELYHVFIKGNGQSLYYAMEDVPVKPDTAAAPRDTALAEVQPPEPESETPPEPAEEIALDKGDQPVLAAPTDTAEFARNSNSQDMNEPPPAAAPGDTVSVADPAQRDTVKKKPAVIQRVMGVNRAECSNIAIYLKDKQVQRIRFLVRPDGKFIPIHLFKEEDAYLGGFTWQGYRRPLDRADIFRKAPLIVEEIDDPKKKKKSGKQ